MFQKGACLASLVPTILRILYYIAVNVLRQNAFSVLTHVSAYMLSAYGKPYAD
jgi:hypothetical protein